MPPWWRLAGRGAVPGRRLAEPWEARQAVVRRGLLQARGPAGACPLRAPPPQGTTRAAPPGPARPPGRVRPPGVDRARLGHRTDRVADRDRLPQTTTPTHARTRRPSSGTGRRATRPPGARAPGEGDATLARGECVGASTGAPTPPAPPLPEPVATTTTRHAGACARPTRQRAREHRAARGAARPPPGASPAVGPGTGGGGGDDHGDTVRVAWGGPAWSAFSLGHARQHGCAQQPNAGGEPRRQPQRGTSEGWWRRLHCFVRRGVGRRLPNGVPIASRATYHPTLRTR